MITFCNLQINCSDIVLFWRIQQVIKVTANALRQQIVNREARRVDKEIKEVLGKNFNIFIIMTSPNCKFINQMNLPTTRTKRFSY
jgi:hypothetical protein